MYSKEHDELHSIFFNLRLNYKQLDYLYPNQISTLMKYPNWILFFLCSIAITFMACSEDSQAKKDALNSLGDPQPTDIAAPATPTPPNPSQPEPPRNAAGVWHYTCPDGHEGGGASAAETCATCGKTLAHNTAYHDQAAPSQPQPNSPTANPAITPPPPTPEPAQNAAGVWHYTCPDGHAGGGASAAETCGVCGKALAHNTAYH